ncbi:TIGR04338 family metallohydrolase [Gordonia sp. NPDC003429]
MNDVPRPRDTGRTRFYEAERMAMRLFEGAGAGRTVRLAGTELTLPVEVVFGSVTSVRDYVSRVLAMPVVVQRFSCATHPVSVRTRRGHRAAEYRPAGPARRTAEIAIPESSEGRWALRELVVLHEIAHHLDDSTGPAHGRGFAFTLTDLVGLVLGAEAEFVYRVLLADSGV